MEANGLSIFGRHHREISDGGGEEKRVLSSIMEMEYHSMENCLRWCRAREREGDREKRRRRRKSTIKTNFSYPFSWSYSDNWNISIVFRCSSGSSHNNWWCSTFLSVYPFYWLVWSHQVRWPMIIIVRPNIIDLLITFKISLTSRIRTNACFQLINFENISIVYV